MAVKVIRDIILVLAQVALVVLTGLLVLEKVGW